MASFWRSSFALFLQVAHIKCSPGWPDGNYGLLQPTTGCPEEWADKTWTDTKNRNPKLKYYGWTNKGFILQDTVDAYPNNNRSKILHIEGFVGPNYVLRYFCVKNTHNSTHWPEGQYCIYKFGSRQYLTMNDKGPNHQHAFKYVRNFAKDWSDSIALYFSCNTTGNKKIPIDLPITKPFYLLPYGSRECQQVKWMVATTDWIKYHTLNYNKQRYHTKLPYHETGNKINSGITMYYCYYESCNYTLNEMKGIFHSPGFPDKYPDGQLCSWRIMVPANHTVHVRFTSFSLMDNDRLHFYTNNLEESMELNDSFNGHHRPFTLTAQSDLEFVFETNLKHSSSGFQAEYSIFIPSETTETSLTTMKNQPTSKPHTTTTPKTSEPQTIKPQTIKPQTTETQKTKTQTTKTRTTKLFTIKSNTTKPETTKHQTDKPNMTNSETNKPPETTTHHTQTLSTTTQCYTPKNRSANSQKGSHVLDSDLPIVVIVIPLIGCILIILLVIDIAFRCRYTTNNPKNNKMDTRGDILMNQPTDQAMGSTTEDSTQNTVNEQPRSRDELPDYEDIDYTQFNEVQPSNKDTAYPESHVLQPVGNDAPEGFYHMLELPTADLDRPTYQNLPEVNPALHLESCLRLSTELFCHNQ